MSIMRRVHGNILRDGTLRKMLTTFQFAISLNFVWAEL